MPIVPIPSLGGTAYVHSCLSSILNYCNVLYMAVSLKSIWKLQMVQNAAVMGKPWHTYVTAAILYIMATERKIGVLK